MELICVKFDEGDEELLKPLELTTLVILVSSTRCDDQVLSIKISNKLNFINYLRAHVYTPSPMLAKLIN